MEIHPVYCPVSGRDVRVASTRSPRYRDGHASIPDDPRLVCLDYSDVCEERAEGSAEGFPVCPVFEVPALVMGIERARAGLTPTPRMIRAFCSGCGSVAEHERIDASYAVCAICGSTNRA